MGKERIRSRLCNPAPVTQSSFFSSERNKLEILVENIYKPLSIEGKRIYCGRRGRGEDGRYGNMFEIGKDGSRADVMRKFRLYIKTPAGIERVARLRKEIEETKAEVIVLQCFCFPYDCHCNVYAEELLK